MLAAGEAWPIVGRKGVIGGVLVKICSSVSNGVGMDSRAQCWKKEVLAES